MSGGGGKTNIYRPCGPLGEVTQSRGTKAKNLLCLYFFTTVYDQKQDIDKDSVEEIVHNHLGDMKDIVNLPHVEVSVVSDARDFFQDENRPFLRNIFVFIPLFYDVNKVSEAAGAGHARCNVFCTKVNRIIGSIVSDTQSDRPKMFKDMS